MLLIYTNQLTPRIKYTFRFVFGKVLGLDYRITDDLDEFNVSHYPRISYTQQPVEGIPFVQARSLLFEKGISNQNIHTFDWEGTPAFFATGKHSLLPFDPFAAIFFMISRYEEYMPYIADAHGRFPSKEAFAFQNNFLQIPIVNIWAKKLADLLKNLFPTLLFSPFPFKQIPTIDVDNAFAYLEKGFIRTVGAIGQDVFKYDFQNLKTRFKTLAGSKKDSYDTFQYLAELHKSAKVKPIFFFLLGNYAQNDRNVPVNNRKFQHLIRSIADENQVGIHPSYASNSNVETLKMEVERLANIIHAPITLSRQHFLKLEFPQTFRNLLDLDIRDDYSLGFADLPGFRAGTSVPFNFFDLDADQETPLLLHPTTVMDATLNRYMKLKPADAIIEQNKLKELVKKYGGEFILLWHNETVSDAFEWKGWQRVYEELFK